MLGIILKHYKLLLLSHIMASLLQFWILPSPSISLYSHVSLFDNWIFRFFIIISNPFHSFWMILPNLQFDFLPSLALYVFLMVIIFLAIQRVGLNKWGKSKNGVKWGQTLHSYKTNWILTFASKRRADEFTLSAECKPQDMRQCQLQPFLEPHTADNATLIRPTKSKFSPAQEWQALDCASFCLR